MSQHHYTQLSLEERIIIQNRLENGETIRDIAVSIGRSPSTISREISRNGEPHKTRVNIPHELYLDSRHFRGTDKVDKIRSRKKSYRKRLHEFNKSHYKAKDAEIKALKRTKEQPLALTTTPYSETRKYVLEKLALRWSPEQISGRLSLEGKLPYVSARAIYAFIYLPENRKLIKHLRRRGKPKRLKTNLSFNKTKNKRNISERPSIIDILGRFGDLEGDTIFGKDTKDRILTHVERKSGLLSASLVRGYNGQNISKQTILDMRRVFGKATSITYDNGSEFTLWQQTEKHLHTTIYFANPYHSWERGRNENANGLIRDFFPKGTDFKKVTKADILEIESLINNRPRKRLQWLTPLEYYESQCCT